MPRIAVLYFKKAVQQFVEKKFLFFVSGDKPPQKLAKKFLHRVTLSYLDVLSEVRVLPGGVMVRS